MTVDEFLSLAREHLRGGWRVMRTGPLRRSVKGAAVWECPVCALDYALHSGGRKRVDFPIQNFVESGNRLGLSQDDANRIAVSADNIHLNNDDSALRARLLDALGVEPEVQS